MRLKLKDLRFRPRPGSISSLMRQYIRNAAGGLLIMSGFSVALLTLLANFILPEKFESTARISLDQPGNSRNELERIRSVGVLSNVIASLNLNKKWAEKFKEENDLPPDKTLRLLLPQVRVSASSDGSLVEVHVLSEDRSEAASLANEIVKVYGNLANGKPQVRLVEPAVPAQKASRPRKGRNITVGFLVGLAIAGAGAAVLSDASKRI